jgi:asparagine synthase (glutamine-hydrolysing)
MCGITGIMAFNQIGSFYMVNLGASMEALKYRGPDQRGTYIENQLALGHRRLSIIDTTIQGKQPMKDSSGNYIIIYNGEIFNYPELKAELIKHGFEFTSETDTEVLLKLYIHYGESCLNMLNGFFSFAIYNKEENTLFVARDRFGIKPLFYYFDEDKFIFASEMKALLSYNIPRDIDFASLHQYLHYNYIPAPNTGIKGCLKLEPGHFLRIKKKELEKVKYYDLEKTLDPSIQKQDYKSVCQNLADLIEESVQKRLMADVPVGSFLSGGIDSSIITALASKHTKDLNTFTIGFKDNPYFDESKQAESFAKKHQTNHITFNLSNQELFEHFHEAIDYLDDPFADSSALPFFALSKQASKSVKVVLSGDGADELFGGYNKHRAEIMVREPDMQLELVKFLGPLWKALPQSRSGKLSNTIRQLRKLAEGSKLTAEERYYRWAGFSTKNYINEVLSDKSKEMIAHSELENRKKKQIRFITKSGNFNEVLRNDLDLVLSNDMLVKADMMSMANSLEVRVPFLDYRIVEFANSLPHTFKTDKKAGKKILKDAFADILPQELLNRPKKGFEVPLLDWLRKELVPALKSNLLSSTYIKEQEIFNPKSIENLITQLYSNNPGDAHARLWAIIIFQYWHKKHILRV